MYRLSFRKFLGLGIEDSVPDATTIENFRHFLEERKLNKVLIAVLDKYFDEIGLIKKKKEILWMPHLCELIQNRT